MSMHVLDTLHSSPSASNSIPIYVPAIKGRFGPLMTFNTQIRPSQVVRILGHDPRSDNWKNLPPELAEIYSSIQRNTSKPRASSASAYLQDRLGRGQLAVFPAISLGMLGYANFKPTGDNPDMGTLF